MLLCINFADEKFRPYQQIQTMSARYFGADDVREYSINDLDAEFREKNKFILSQPRGAGYWVWKPYIIKDALSRVNDGDFVFYADSGAMYVNPIRYLTDIMEKQKLNIMVFGGYGQFLERAWTKRDAFILMDCDEEKYWDSPQIAATYVLFKKSREAESLVEDWLKYIQDPRIVTDMPNQLGKENLPEFQENRHDQSILSLLVKKRNLPVFLDPSGQRLNLVNIPQDILDRSQFPIMFCLHRRKISLQRTFSDFISIYANEPRLSEGIRSVKFLLNEGMIEESCILMRHLLDKYHAGNNQAWLNIYYEVLTLFDQHRAMGAPYSEIVMPHIFQMFLQIIRCGVHPNQIYQLINVVRQTKNKAHIPQEFIDALAHLVSLCAKKSINYSWLSSTGIVEYYNDTVSEKRGGQA